MMKWRVRRNSQCSLTEQDDVRRSIDVLDSVLAEFDDYFESWEHCKKFSEDNNVRHSNGIKNRNEKWSSDEYLKDGSFSNLKTISQVHPASTPAPPIPLRSPATHLSNRFSFSGDDITLTQYALSLHQISQPLSASKNDTTRHSGICGCDIMESEQDEAHLSPFLQRRKMFEDKIAGSMSKGHGITDDKKLGVDSDSRGKGHGVTNDKKPQDSRCGHSLNNEHVLSNDSRKNDMDLDLRLGHSLDDEQVLSNDKKFGKESDSRVRHAETEEHVLAKDKTPGGNSSMLKREKISDNNVLSPEMWKSEMSGDVLSNDYRKTKENVLLTEEMCKKGKCSCVERIIRLREQFSETLRLLEFNAIDLDIEMPSFIPPLPPATKYIPHKTPRKSSHPRIPTSDSLQDLGNLTKEPNWKTASDSRLADSSSSPQLCKKSASNSYSSHLSETIEDLPYLLPTDALNRPQLGLSYSLEEDLSPGVKEIRQTSTPVSSPKSMSTFSQSNSSLGYVSSQSDLELNSIPVLPDDKIPLSSFRSRTLPNGLERSPFYHASEDIPSFYSENNGYDSHHHHLTPQQHHFVLRSSSASPKQESEKTKKKHFRGFSRKEKIKKNEDNLSLASDQSVEDKILSISFTDGSTIPFDSAVSKAECREEGKRRSVWKSIIRKKT